MQDCLRAFTAPEELPLSEGYHCGKCRRVQAAEKRLQLARLPTILVLHLKRFLADAGLFFGGGSFKKVRSSPPFS